jgi:hypothetical protein
MDTHDKIEIEKLGYDAERIMEIERSVERRYVDAVWLLAHDLYRIYTKTDDPLWKAGEATMQAYMTQARKRLAARG